MCLTFDGDDDKAAANLRKHRIAFADATYAFLDPWRMERFDPGDHAEDRYTAVAAIEGQAVFVVYTVRHDAIRLISAREATRYEAIGYWKNRALRS